MTKPPLEIVLFFQGDDSEMPEMSEPIARRAGLRVCLNIYPALAAAGLYFQPFTRSSWHIMRRAMFSR